MAKMKVGLVGCGNIGADLCIALHKNEIPATICALTDLDESRAQLLRKTFELDAKICDLDTTAELGDLIVECAAAEAVKSVVDAAIARHKDCLVLSMGGLMDHPELLDRAREHKIQIRVPSGALCGLDGIRAAIEGGVHTVTISIRKSPKGLEGAPYLVENNIDLSGLTESQVVFEGTAKEACRAFPRNVNTAAALSFLGIGAEETLVRVIADPRATVISHELVAEGAFGKLTTITENHPSPRNVKSSYLASLSAVAELRAAAEAFAAHHGN